VSDSFYTNTTTIILHVQDVNDNPPEFTQSEYIISDVVEEENPPQAGRFLVQVKLYSQYISYHMHVCVKK